VNEVTLLSRALEGLIAAGPVAIVLGTLCYVLWKQNQSLISRNDRQHKMMLKLAVRVQRAVEVLAGIEHEETEVETVLNEEERLEAEEERERKRLADKELDKEV
jgi:hypothetical protein